MTALVYGLKIDKFMTQYKAAEQRAIDSGNGKAFQVEDRRTLVDLISMYNLTPYDCAKALAKRYGGDDKAMRRHASRLYYFQMQVDRERSSAGAVKAAPAATGEHIGESFDGRIKTIRDVQPAFDRAARQLVKVGITSPEAAQSFLVRGFETVKSDMKVERKVDRILPELQNGELSREEVIKALELLKTKF